MKHKLELRSDIVVNLCRADLVQFNDELLQPDYLHVPDETASRDDVLVECTMKNGQELDLTLDELASAEYLGEGAYRVKNRGIVRFLQMAAIH